MIRLIAFAAFALATATSAQALSAPPRPQLDGLSTAEAQHVGYRYRGVARGYVGGPFAYRSYDRYAGVRPYAYRYNRYGYAGVTPYRYRGYNRYVGVRPYGYRYNRYGYVGVRPYGYRAYRPYSYGVARRQVRRCALWDAGQVCRRWY